MIAAVFPHSWLGEQTVRYWLRGEHLPQDTLTIEDRLFGSDFSSCTVWRFELREALARSRAAGRNGDAPAPADGPVTPQAPAAPPLLVSNIPIRAPAHFMGRDAQSRAPPLPIFLHHGYILLCVTPCSFIMGHCFRSGMGHFETRMRRCTRPLRSSPDLQLADIRSRTDCTSGTQNPSPAKPGRGWRWRTKTAPYRLLTKTRRTSSSPCCSCRT
jgi:hypothetical protein